MKTLTKFTIGFFAALFAYASYAAPVEIKFGTGNITVQNDFAAVLNNSGINYQQLKFRHSLPLPDTKDIPAAREIFSKNANKNANNT